MTTVQYSRLDSSLWQAGDYYDAWNNAIWPIFDACPVDPKDVRAFDGDICAWQAGSAVLAMVNTGTIPQRFTRTAAKIGMTGLDLIFVQLFLSGGDSRRVGPEERRCVPGDIALTDMTRPIETIASDCRTLNLLLPRTSFGPVLEADRLHGTIVAARTASGKLLGEYLQSLWARISTLSPDEVPAVIQGTAALIACMSRPALAGREDSVSLTAIKLPAIRDYIEAHLSDAGLTPTRLCHHFALSRATLYRMFEPLGGVCEYIRQRRLYRSYDALISPLHSRSSVAEIAYAWGFRDASTFSRAFRAQFGSSPGEARELGAGHRSRLLANVASDRHHPLPKWLRTIDRSA